LYAWRKRKASTDAAEPSPEKGIIGMWEFGPSGSG
jgi:hypothetical protein